MIICACALGSFWRSFDLVTHFNLNLLPGLIYYLSDFFKKVGTQTLKVLVYLSLRRRKTKCHIFLEIDVIIWENRCK